MPVDRGRSDQMLLLEFMIGLAFRRGLVEASVGTSKFCSSESRWHTVGRCGANRRETLVTELLRFLLPAEMDQDNHRTSKYELVVKRALFFHHEHPLHSNEAVAWKGAKERIFPGLHGSQKSDIPGFTRSKQRDESHDLVL